MIDQLLSAIDATLPEPLTDSQRKQLTRHFRAVLDHDPVKQVCSAVDELGKRGLGITAIKAGGLELACYSLPPKPKEQNGQARPDLGEDDPVFDAVR